MAAGESITPGTDIVMQTITGSAGKESIDPQDNLNDQQYYQQQLENEAKEKVKSELSAQQETEKQAEVVREDILVKIKDIENEISKIASENAARKAELASLPQNQDQRTKLQKLYDEGVQKVDTAYKEMILAKQKFDEVQSRAGQDQRYKNNEYIRDFQAARSAWAGAERSYLDAMKTAPGYTYSGEGLGWVDATLNATGDPTVFSERKYISKYDMAVSSARSVLNNIKSGIESSKDPEEINRLFTQFKEKSSYLKELEAASPFEHGKMQKIGLRPTEFLQTLDTRGGGDVENAAYNAREAEASAKQSQSQLQSRNASILASGGKLSSDQIADVSRSAMDVNIKTAEVNTITALQDYLKAAEKGDTDKLKDLEKDYIDKYVKEQSIKESQSTQLLSSIPTLGKVTDADVSPKIGTVSIDGNAMDVFSDRSTGRDFVNFFGNKISVSDINTLKQAAGGTGLFNSYGQQVMAIKDIYGKSSKDQYGNLIDDYGNKVTLQNADKYKNADEYIKGELRDPSKSVLDIYKFGATPVKDMTSDQKLQAVLLTAQSKGLDISKVTDTQKSSWDMIDTSKLSNLTDVNAIAGSLIRGSDISKEYQFRTPFKSQIPFISQISETSGSVTKNAPSWRFNAYTPTPVPVGYMPLEIGGETLAVKLLGKASDVIKPAKIPLDTESTSGAEHTTKVVPFGEYAKSLAMEYGFAKGIESIPVALTAVVNPIGAAAFAKSTYEDISQAGTRPGFLKIIQETQTGEGKREQAYIFKQGANLPSFVAISSSESHVDPTEAAIKTFDISGSKKVDIYHTHPAGALKPVDVISIPETGVRSIDVLTVGKTLTNLPSEGDIQYAQSIPWLINKLGVVSKESIISIEPSKIQKVENIPPEMAVSAAKSYVYSEPLIEAILNPSGQIKGELKYISEAYAGAGVPLAIERGDSTQPTSSLVKTVGADLQKNTAGPDLGPGRFVPTAAVGREKTGITLAVKLLGKASDVIKPSEIPLDTESTSGAGGRGAKSVSKSKSSELSIVEPISSLFSETSVNAKDLQSSISSGRNPIINSISEVASVLSGVNPFVVSATTADIGTDIISGKATPESVTSKAVEGAIEATPLKNVVSIIEGGQGSQPVVVASIENIQNSLSQLTQPVLNQMPIKDLPIAATDVLLLANPVTSPFVVSGNMIKFDSNGNALGFGGKGAQNLLTDIQKPSDVEMKSGSDGKTESIEVDVIGNAKKLVWDIPYELGGYVAETSIGNQKSNKNKVTKESIEKVLEKSPNIVIKKSKDDKGNDVIEWMSQENVKKMKSYDSKKEKDLFNKGDKYISDINEYVYGNSKLKSAVSRSESQMPYTIPSKPDVIHFNGVDSNKGLDIVKQNDIKKVNTTVSDKDTREWYGYSQLYPQIKSNSTQINPYGSDLKRYGSTMGLNMKLTYNINKKNRGEEMDLQSSLLKDSMNAMAKLQTGFINLTGGAASTVGSALSGLSGNPQLPPVQNQNTDINKKINMGSVPSSSSASVMPSLIPIANYTPKQTPSIDKTYTTNNIPVQLPYISQVPGSPIPIQTSSPPSPQETLKSQSKPQSVIQVQGSLVEPGIDYKKQISGYNTDVGDSITRNMIGKTYDISWGPDKGTSMKINSLADALEYKRQQSEAGVNPDIKGINTQARAADYYRNELDKLAQNDVRLSSDYHHAAIKTGVNVGPNPYENAGDAALTFLKGGGRDVLSKSYNWNPSIVGDLGVANLLPGGKGTQETAWSGDKGANFFPAISSWQSAKSSYGPYGSLAKGSNESVSLMPKAYQQALVDIGSGKREGSVYSYAIPDSFVRSQESIRGIVPYNEMTPQQQRQADQEYQNLIANTPDAEFFVPDGKGKQKQIIGKGIVNPKTGQFEIYQPHTDPASGQNMRMYQAVGGGGQNAIASGEFSVGTPLTPLVTTQEGTGRIDTTKYGYKLGDAEAVQRALDTHTYDETYSDVGSDIYGGTVQRLRPGKFNRMYEPAVGKDEISSAYDNILTSITGKKNSEDVSRVIVTPDIGTTNYWNMNTKLTSGNLKNLLGDETGTEKPTGSFAWVYPIGEKSPLVTQTDNTPYKSKQEYTVPTSIGYGNTIYGKSGGLDYETLKNVSNVVIKPSNSPNYVGTDSNGNLIQATISGEKVDGKPVSTVADKPTQYDTVIPAVPGVMGLTSIAQSSGESRDVGKDKSVDITKNISNIPLALIPLALATTVVSAPTAIGGVAIKHATKDNEAYNSLYPQQKYELDKVSPDISSRVEYLTEVESTSGLNKGEVGFPFPSSWQSMYIGSQLLKVPRSVTNIAGDFTGYSETGIETKKYESMNESYNKKLDKYNTDLADYTTLQSQQSKMWDQAMSTGKVKDNVFQYDPQNSSELNLATSLNDIDNKLAGMYGDLSTKESELKSDLNALNDQKQKIDKTVSDSEYYSLGKIFDNLEKVTMSSTTGMVMPDISSKISQSKEARSIVGESVISAPLTIFLPGSQILVSKSKLIPDNVKTEVGSIPVGLGTGIYDWVREKPIDVMATYLTGKAFPLVEYKGSQVLAAGATSELPVVKTVAQKVSGSPLLTDAYIATTRGVLPAAYVTDVTKDIIGDDTTDNSTLARSQRAGKNIAQFGTFMKGMNSVNLPAVENPYAVRDLDRPLEKARIFASSRLNAIGMEPGQRTAYLEGINPYKSTRYIEPYKTTEQPDISSLSEIGPKLGPAIEQASIETPHAMMGSGVVEAQASNLPTAKKLRKGKDYDVNTHPLDFVTNLQRIIGGKLVKSSSPRAETSDLIIGGKKVAIDPHEFVSGYPDVPGRRYNVEPGYYNEDTVGLGTLLFGDPVNPLPRPEELTIAGKTEGYKGKINFEKLNVQSAKKSKALMNDLQDPMNKGYRLDKDLYDSISIKNELIAVERSRGVTATREKELKLAEKSNEKILDQTITYKNKAGEIKTEKLRDIYNRMENDVIAGNIPPATLTITTSKPSTGVIGKIGKSVGVNIVTSKGLLQRKPFVKTPSKIYDITSSKSKSPVKPSIRSISELPKGSISELKPTDYSKPQLDEPPSPPPQKGSDVYGSPSPSQYSYFTSVSPSYIESPSPSPSPSQSPSEMSPIYNIKYPGYPGTPFMTGAGGGGGGIPGGRPLGIVVKNPLAGLEIAGSAKKYMNFSNVNSGIKNIIGNFGGKTKALNPLGNSQSITSNPTGRGVSLSEATSIQRKKQSLKPKAKLSNTVLKTPSINMNINTNIHNKKKGKRKK